MFQFTGLMYLRWKIIIHRWIHILFLYQTGHDTRNINQSGFDKIQDEILLCLRQQYDNNISSRGKRKVNNNGSYRYNMSLTTRIKYSSKAGYILNITWRFIALLLIWDSLTKKIVCRNSFPSNNIESPLKQECKTHGNEISSPCTKHLWRMGANWYLIIGYANYFHPF